MWRMVQILSVVLVALLALLAEARPRRGGIQRGNATKDAFPLFAFATESGVGMGAGPCAGTTPTGTRGQLLTFTRASARSCMKGNETTGIANGDLVMLTTGQPAVMPGGDGTGGLGLGVWEARTNSATYSEQFDHAAWTKAGNGGGVLPVVTANAGTAPDGTLTAERVQFSACPTTGDDSVVYQNTSVATATSSVYVKGVSGSGSISVCQYNHPSSPACITCAFNSTTWARCSGPPTAAGGTYILLGCENNTAVYPGGSNTGAADVYLWGAQHEAGATVSPYIKTEGTAQTRVAEVAYFALPASVSPGCIAGSAQVSWSSTSVNRRIARIDSSGSDANRFELFFPAAARVSSFVSVASAPQQFDSAIITLPGLVRAVGYRTPSTTQGVIVNGTDTSTVTALGALPALNRFYVGAYASTGYETNGVVSRLQADPSPTRCR